MDSERLARYLTGEASATERAQIERWAEADGANRIELERLHAAWADRPAPDRWDVDRAWAAVSRRIDEGGGVGEVIPIRRPVPIRWLAAAAVVLAVAGVGGWLGLRSPTLEYATGIGQQETISLPDGSEVTLGPASRLVVARGYGRPARSLSLTGQAWFVVTHDEARPFTVSVAQTQVVDLGTEFEVNAIGPMVRVAVAHGSVAVRRPDVPEITLTAGQMATVAPRVEPRVRTDVAIERMTSWRQGTLDFVDRPLSEVTAELERWYDVSFELDASITTKTYNGPIPTGRLDDALEVLTTALGLAEKRTGRVVTLTPRGAS